jgi:hypothetical protein
MKHVGETDSNAIKYMPDFTRVSSGILKLIGGIHRQHGELASLLLFSFDIRKIG